TIKESLAVTMFCDVVERSPASMIRDSCALRNSSHVFHRDCIDRWLDYECRGGDEDNHRNCPLCRTLLLPANTTWIPDWPTNNQPS
ncbi:hypothetical protein EUTSA_v10003086mg, partial [Eutrema salsugineum]